MRTFLIATAQILFATSAHAQFFRGVQDPAPSHAPPAPCRTYITADGCKAPVARQPVARAKAKRRY